MNLFANLLRGRHRKGRPSQGAGLGTKVPNPRIRSLADLNGHFPWPDIGMAGGGTARREIRNPLAIAVRALRVVEYAQATGSEHGDDGMVFLGLSQALDALARHGEWDTVGTLLNALEVLIDPFDRQRWLGGVDPYVEPKGA